MNWIEYLSVKKNKIEFLLTIIFLTISLLSLTNFLQYAESRSGAVLDDTLLRHLGPIDLTWFTFSFIYLSIIIAVASLINHPARLVFAFQVYVLIIISRILSMYLLPLNPPVGIIILNDPFVQIFGTGKILTKDLFFSGHTATLLLLAIVSSNKKLKIIFIISTILVAFFVLAQHVHYTIDVVAAPVYVYACYNFALFIRNKIHLNEFKNSGY
jgi:hypothetical protein